MAKRLKGELRRNAKKQGEPAEINDHGVRQLLLSGSVACRLLTQTWLVDALDKAQAPLPEIRNTAARLGMHGEESMLVKRAV